MRETNEKKNNNKSKGGLDAFHRDQDFVWISENNREDGKISEIRSDTRKRKYRMEEQDRKAFHSLFREDQNHVKHRWWEPDWERTACLVHFVNECMAQSSDPFEVMYSSATAKGKSGKEERHAMWRKYLTQHRIDVSHLPVMVMHQLHLDRETNSKRGRKPAGKTKATKKGVDTYIESMKSGPLTHEKRKKRGTDEKKERSTNVAKR